MNEHEILDRKDRSFYPLSIFQSFFSALFSCVAMRAFQGPARPISRNSNFPPFPKQNVNKFILSPVMADKTALSYMYVPQHGLAVRRK